jgi:hypothetical protein
MQLTQKKSKNRKTLVKYCDQTRENPIYSIDNVSHRKLRLQLSVISWNN